MKSRSYVSSIEKQNEELLEKLAKFEKQRDAESKRLAQLEKWHKDSIMYFDSNGHVPEPMPGGKTTVVVGVATKGAYKDIKKMLKDKNKNVSYIPRFYVHKDGHWSLGLTVNYDK